MSTSRERFAVPNFIHLKIQRHTVQGFIPVQNMFFAARRNAVRGLEEWIAHYNHEEEHDYLNRNHLYELTDPEGGKLFVLFKGTEAIFGSKAVLDK